MATARTGTLTITFDDDAPTTFVPQAASLTNAAGSAVFFDLDAAPGDDNILNNLGADGGVARINASVDNTDSGLTSGAVKIWYILDPTGQILLGKTGVDAATRKRPARRSSRSRSTRPIRAIRSTWTARSMRSRPSTSMTERTISSAATMPGPGLCRTGQIEERHARQRRFAGPAAHPDRIGYVPSTAMPIRQA